MKENCETVCVFCKIPNTDLMKHHIIPKSKEGSITVKSCKTCENFIHKTWTHNELRDIYNNVETILASEQFQKFLKWKLKQPATSVFFSSNAKGKNRTKYN